MKRKFGKSSNRKRKNPMTRTWDNLRRWIYLYLPSYASLNKIINREKAIKECNEYFDKSPDPMEELVYRKGVTVYERYRLFSEDVRNVIRYGKPDGPRQYIRKYYGESGIIRNAIMFFADEWEKIYQSNNLKIEKNNLWRKITLEDVLTEDNMPYRRKP